MSVSTIFITLLECFRINCVIFFVTLALALPLGLLVSFGSMSNWRPLRFLQKACKPGSKIGRFFGEFRLIRSLVRTFVWIIRGTPLMLQIIVIFYGPGLIWGGTALPRVSAAIVAFVINYACYFSEIYRGGIESIPRGQYEAGQVLGMTKSQIFFRVTLLQVVKRIIPPMGNEFMTLIKDTSLANIISNKEIIMMAQEFSVKGLIWPLFSTAIFFLIFCGALTLIFGRIERKMSYFRA